MNRLKPLLLAIAACLLSTAAAAQAGYVLTTLASLNGSNGGELGAGLTLSGNTLYGTTASGGAYSQGTVFSVPITGGTPTVLASFNGSNGEMLEAGLTLSGSTLYGTAYYGGAGYSGANGSGDGTVFSLPITGGTPTVLVSFNGPNGRYPSAGLILSGNTLYGTTENGGTFGTVFSVPVTGGTPTVLASFTSNGIDGAWPSAGLTLSGNTLYGTTSGGGAYGGYDGAVFSVPITGATPTVLASFNGSNGQSPLAGLTLSGNTLYGTTEYGGAGNTGNCGELTGDGTVFSVPITGGTPTVLASFNGSNGKGPCTG